VLSGVHSFQGERMKAIKFGAGFTVFVLFFGISLFEAFQNHEWTRAVLWLLVGTVFLIADNIRKHEQI
jgi:hypothetical protein